MSSQQNPTSTPNEGPIQFEWASDEQQSAVEARPGPPILLLGGFNSGKRLSVDTPIPTPAGWATMGSLMRGDVVFAEDGRPCRVIAAHPIEDAKSAYRVTFSDHTSIEADAEHLWITWDHAARKAWGRLGGSGSRRVKGPRKTVFPANWPTWSTVGCGKNKNGNAGAKVRTTAEIAASLVAGSGSWNHTIPNARPLLLPDANLPIDPYLLGIWLGDGNTRDGAISIGRQDVWIVDELRRRGHILAATPSSLRRNGGCPLYRVVGLTTALRNLGVLGAKRVPPLYLRASESQRAELLAGLLDSDGTVSPAQSEFDNMNLGLANAVAELLRSLGHRPTVLRSRATLYGRDYGTQWRVCFKPVSQVFRLPRKAAVVATRFGARASLRGQQRMIVAVEMISPRPMRCITVDSPNGLYLAGDGMVPTHNTSAAILHFIALCEAFPGYKVAVLRKTFKDLTHTTRPSFDQWIDGKRLKVNNKDEVIFDNGSSFIFHHLDSPDSATILKGLEINGALLDQAEQMQERVFNVLLGRLGRNRGAKVPAWVIASRNGEPWPWLDNQQRPIPPAACVLTANPTEEGDPELHWLWQRFCPESKLWRQKYSKKGYRQIVFDSRHNKFAGQQNIDILLEQDDDYIARFVRGEWVRSKGHIFKVDPQSLLDYDEELVARIQNTMACGRVLDHGDTVPTCCIWYGVDADHNIYCVSPDTRILRSDLSWVAAGTISTSDTLVGFDETPSRRNCHRKYETATVEKVSRTQKECFRVSLSDGTSVVCSHDHMWLTQVQGGGNTKWRKTSELVVAGTRPHGRTGPHALGGDKLIKMLDVWNDDTSFDGGYVASAFDGEGCLCYSVRRDSPDKKLSLTLGQKPNELLDNVRSYLSANVNRIGYTKGISFPVVTGLEYLGEREVVAIQTSTRTYIAEGLASHNCYQEYYQPGVTKDGKEFYIADHRRSITEMSKGVTYRTSIADPSIFFKSRNVSGFVARVKRWSVADEYLDNTVIKENTRIPWSPADNNEALSRQRLRQYLRPDPYHKHPLTGEIGAPHIYFIMRSETYPHGCDRIVSEIRNARKLQVGESDGRPVFSEERDPAMPDHALDCARYLVNAHAIAASVPPPLRTTRATAHDDGRILIEMPAIRDMPLPPRQRTRTWRSKDGGY